MARNTVISISGLASQPAAEMEESYFDTFPQRTVFQKISYPPRLSLNGLLIGLLCTLLIAVMGYVTVGLPSPLNIGTQVSSYDQLTMMQYTFQIPVALFVAAFLGPFMGFSAVLLFLVIGLCVYPIFANGGGLHYVAEPGFGYLMGTLIMSYLLGKTFYKAFQKQDNASRSIKILVNAIAAVLLVHIIGLLYLVGLSVTGQVPCQELPGWALRLTVETMPYDMLATSVLLCLVRQARLALWLVLY